MDSKKCSKCKIEKALSEFTRIKKDSIETRPRCKFCIKEDKLKYSRTIKGLCSIIYNDQVKNSKKRKMNRPKYTKKELFDWIVSQSSFNYYYQNWVDSGYKSELRPSIDRLDDYKGYSFDNIQLTTWENNRNKVYEDRKNGINNKNSKTVLQYDINGNFINSYYSATEAYRKTNIHFSNILSCCNNIYKTSGGYVWKFKKDKQNENIK